MNHRDSLAQYADQVLEMSKTVPNPHGYKLLVISTLDEPGNESDGAYTIRSGRAFTINIAIALLTRAAIALAVAKQWDSP